MPERIPRRILRAVLVPPVISDAWGSREEMVRTTFDETAPLRFPQLMSMPVATPRLYDPSKLLDIHAMTFGTHG